MKLGSATTIEQSIVLNQLHIFALCGIGVAYPIFSFLVGNPVYLVANGVDSSLLYLLIALLSCIIPAGLIAFDLALYFTARNAYALLHHALVGILAGLCLLPLLSRIDAMPIWLTLLFTATLVALTIREIRTNRFTYTCLAILAPLAIGFPIHFAMDHNIGQILNPKQVEGAAWQADASDDLPPVVMIIFDEFPLVHLLDAEGNIDGRRFPNFASMGDESTWYSNATTVHDQTMKAIPSILTGLHPEGGLIVPIPENYPESLFNILRGQYQIHASESVTQLSRAYTDDFELPDVNIGVLVSDIAIFYMRSLLPARTADAWLPLENGIWGGFLQRMPERRREESRAGLRKWLDDNNEWRTGSRALKNRYQVFEEFFEDVESFPRNTFHYFHITVPHHPYTFLPSGRLYSFSFKEDIARQHSIRLKREAHILQMGLADTMLGDIRAKLVDLELWDDAVVVVVADHGEGYEPNKNNRIITPQNIGYIGFVPLLIKYPGQTKGEIDDTNVQTIDIAPTILDVLNIQNGPRMDGRSLINPEALIPGPKMIMSDSGKKYRIPEDVYTLGRSIAHVKAVRFFDLKDSRSDLFNYGAGLDYVGMKLDDVKEYHIPAQLGIYDSKQYRTIPPDTKYFPALVEGEVLKFPQIAPRNLVVAISINGTIQAVTTPFFSLTRKLRFHKVLPEHAFAETNEIAVVLLPAKKPEPK